MTKRVSIDDVFNWLESKQPMSILDIRDPQSFAQGHIENSINLNNVNAAQVLNEIKDETAIVVVCYHGHSSIGAAQYILNQGFEEVFSMDGGVEAWRLKYPVCH